MDADLVGNEPTGTRPDHAADRDPVDPFGGHDLEPPLLLALAAGGSALAWVSGSGQGPWTAAVAVAVLAVTAALARLRDRRPPAFALRASRAGLSLSAAAVAVGVGHTTPGALLAWFPAVCAVYTVVFAAGAATGFTIAALGVLALMAADPHAGGPSETAYATCAVAVLAVSLAGRTLRAVLAALRGARREASATMSSTPATSASPSPAAPSPAVPSPAQVVIPSQAAPALTARFHGPTSLPGRDELLQAVTRAQSRAGVVGGEVGLLVLTVQGAGTLAASLGAAPAQEVLETLARRARAWLPAGDVVAWIPEGRLAVLLEGVDADACAVVARRLAALLAEPVTAGRQVVSLPTTAALALAEGPQESPAELLRRAEDAPAIGDGPVRPAPVRSPLLVPNDALAAELWPALAAGEVTVALQPIVALGTLPRHDGIVAFEALARWTKADGTTVPPSRFVPAARRSGLADLLGATVLAQGLAALRERRDRAADANAGLSVNVAPEQLAGGGVAATILQSLEAAGVEPSALTVEVPAATAFDDVVTARSVLETLRDAGVRVALDNFGAAGLSIAALRDLPLTGVKLDRSLTADLGADDRLVVATVRLTTRLGLTCTAVGVETQTQLDAARSLGIDAVQGHLLGRPEGASTQVVAVS